MLNLESIKKMMPDYFIKVNNKKLKVKKGHNMQRSSKDTIDKFISALVLGQWILCKDVIDNTGLTQGTISRAAAHLIRDKVISKKALQEGRCKNTYYKLA